MANHLQMALDEGYYKIILGRIFKKFYVDNKGCWIWTGSINENGYGSINIGFRVKIKVHRFIAYCFHGLDLFDLNLQACHSCDIRNCINPFHIWIGTKSDNFKDAVKKGRWHNQYYNNLEKEG